MASTIPKANLYEIIFRLASGSEAGVALQIDKCIINNGHLSLETTDNRRTRFVPLNSDSSVLIPPGGHCVVRAYPRREAFGETPSGSFAARLSSGESEIFYFPWDQPPASKLNGYDESKTQEVLCPDVMIVGSGPLGATFAKKIITEKPSATVMMVEMGARESVVIGEHKKNAVGYQRDIDSFVHVIKGALSTLSVPVKKDSLSHPWAWGNADSNGFVQKGQNPDQDPNINLGASAATRVVGGMATHWTCATPRQHKVLERSDMFTDSEWNDLYTEAEGYLGTNREQFEGSLRHQLVKNTLLSSFSRLYPGREVLSLPLAARRDPNNPSFVTWAASNTILGNTVEKLHLYPNHQCTKLLHHGDEVKLVALKNLSVAHGRLYVCPGKSVVCAGAVLTPQLLWNSGWRNDGFEGGVLPALGKYMTEQPMAFCQVILHEALVAQLDPDTPNYPEWVTPELRAKIEEHRQKHPEDPLPFPLDDPEPQITTPVHDDWPWHTQIHRDAFSYGDVAPNMDSRLVVDLRWFGMVEIDEENKVTYSDTIKDQFNMPQPTFHYVLRDDARTRCHRMMEDMIRVSLELGRYIPGSEPQFMEPGLALHVCGTTRAGSSATNSVVDQDSKVWGMNNLWLGGNGVVPTKNASNPTLTSMCFAIKGANKLISEL